MFDSIRFYYQGAAQSVQDISPIHTVLQYLREDRRHMGTKEGCAEGDCGACMVVVGELQGDKLILKAVNACIQLLPTLDGKALFTIEDLAQPNGAMHPIQHAMVANHASQCGFCTPGFIMSLWALYEKYSSGIASPPLEEIHDALSGNLCRCTGYRAIATAAENAYALPRSAFDHKALVEALQELHRHEMFSYWANGQGFFAPRSLTELHTVQQRYPEACLIAGTTDVGLWVTQQMRDLGTLIYLNGIRELQTVQERDGMLEIGAGVTLNDAYEAICRHYPQELSQLWRRFASLPIRNAGTLCGNIANGSPIGDSMPWLLAVDAELILHSSDVERVVPLHGFYVAYQKKDLRPGELIKAVRIPLPTKGLKLRTYKLSKRFDQDISAVCAAFALHLQDDGVIRSARVAFGGMAAIPKRAAQTEAALIGQTWDEQTLFQAMEALSGDYSPLSDMRASSEYRLVCAQQLLRRFWLETRLIDPLPDHAVNVFTCSNHTEQQ